MLKLLGSGKQSGGARRPARDEIAAALARYRGLVEDWGALLDALEAPHVPCVWANPLKVEPGGLARHLEEEGAPAEPIGWAPGAFRLRGCRPGLLWPYLTGLCQVQEEASMAPVRLLSPRPGERVLDLCAAPGGKTAQIAAALGRRGTVVANDLSAGRLAAVQNLLCRLGLVNVTVTGLNGCAFPLAAGSFDRVLVDAPCSSEGTLRTARSAAPVTGEFHRHTTGIQRSLLRRALALTRPGGRVVYSTCTFAPEENELVVDDVLRAHPGAARLLPAQIPGLAGGPGITCWEGRRLQGELERCLRLWPHVSDTGGFFVAVLERTAAPMKVSPGEPPRPPRQRDRLAALEHPAARAVLRRYRIADEALSELDVIPSGRYLRLVAADHRAPAGIRPVSVGLPGMPSRMDHPRFATAGAMAFGGAAESHVVDLEPEESSVYLAGRELRPRGPLPECTKGYLLVRRAGAYALGNGLIRDPGSPRLESHFPRGWRSVKAAGT